jgi:3-deoxy-7-phosphoheptulonate synthase
MSKAAVAAGADGLMVEVHPDPENALSDGFQSLFPEQFKQVVEALRPFLDLEGKSIEQAATAQPGV